MPNPFSRKRKPSTKAVVQPAEEPRPVKGQRIAGLRPRDRFAVDGQTYVLNSISEDMAEVTQMASRKNVTGYDKRGKPILTEYEYGAQILKMPLNTQID